MSLDLTIEIFDEMDLCFSDQASFITLPAANGEIGILPKHIKLFSALKSGNILVRKEEAGNKKEEFFKINGGFAEIENNKIRLFAEGFERVKVDGEIQE